MSLDKYYTNRSVATVCMSALIPYINHCSAVVEPSAGNGNFIFDGVTTHAYDIAPERGDIVPANWLFLNEQFGLPENVCIYGNPPFGKRNSLTKAFIEKSCSLANVVAFVLPSVYNKHSMQKVFSSEWALVESLEIPVDSFTDNGKVFTIPSVFQIWIKNYSGKNLRKQERVSFTNKHFSLVRKQGDFFVMGASPNVVKLPEDVSMKNRGYWIKCHEDVDVVMANFRNCQWQGHSCASGGVAWRTKAEIMDNYEREYDESKQ